MAKGIMYIDGQRVPFDGEKNVLAVIRKAGIDMPTFCYYSELSVYGACRMCVVEDEKGKIDASCSMEPRDGMVIRTNTARLLKHRRMILELMLSSHCRDCTTCEKSGNCRLQDLALRFGVRHVRFQDTRPVYEKDHSSPAIVRDPNKCILCGDCVRVCEEMQGMSILNFAHRGHHHPGRDRQGVAGAVRPQEAGGVPDRAGGPCGGGRGIWPGAWRQCHRQAGVGIEDDGRRRGVRHQLRRGPDGDGGV